VAVRRDGNQSGSRKKKARSVRPQTKTPTSGVERTPQPKARKFAPTPVVRRTDGWMRALRIRSEALNRIYGLAPMHALEIRGEAMNRVCGLGDSEPSQAGGS